MEKREEDELGWLMVNNPTVPTSPSGKPIQTHPMPENHHHPMPENYRHPMPENQRQRSDISPAAIGTPGILFPRLSPASRNHPFLFPQTESNSYNPNLDHYDQNIGLPNTSVHVNPSFPETLYDPSLETVFSHLSLSSPNHISSFLEPSIFGNNSLVNSSTGMRFPPISYAQTQYSNMDLQRMRVQSAVSGQTGLYPSPQGFPTFGDDYQSLDDLVIPSLNSSNFNDFDFDIIYNEGRSLAATMNNRLQRSRLNRSGFLSTNESGYGVQNMSNGNGLILPYESSGDGFRSSYESDYWVRNMSNGNGLRSPYESGYGVQTMSDGNGLRARSVNVFEADSLSSLYNNNNNNNNNVYRSRQRLNLTSLEDLKGRLFSVTKDQHGCRFLQQKIEEGNPEEIEIIFSELKGHVCELMIHQFGNYLMQKFFEVCNKDQMTEALLSVINNDSILMDICLDAHGTRAMQSLLKHLKTQEQRSLVIAVIRRITVPLTKSMNGHHVIDSCLGSFSSEDKKHILNVVADNCLDIATDKSGCCVLQQCVAHARGEPKQRLVAEITANASVLAEHPFGNYVVQYIIGMKIPHVTADILSQLKGNYFSLSLSKYGSNVVEKGLKESGEDQAMKIIDEIVSHPNFLTVLQDQYGNYVAQSALAVSKGAIHYKLITTIQSHYAVLHSHPFGKRVLAKARGSKHRIYA
ncbi:unnamed protein product [Ilex paraguariensis]|uniref:PUM-HD domain-containing protein n=1 Tax=Ilex paraguariensis TaxID=185542 RepID=A0ABC8V176_9AQUA